MKYIVKNCPALLNNETIYMECQDETTEHLQCWENEDCIIKQIVELCKNVNCYLLVNTSINSKTRKNRCGAIDSMPLCCEVIAKKDILDLLEIEEVSNEY